MACYNGPVTHEAPLELWLLRPCWGMASGSPFCVKLDAWLRMAGLPFEVRVLEGLPKSANGKAPYVVLPDGRTIADSAVIMETLAHERGLTLDEGLDDDQRALATAVTRMLEDHFYWVIAWDRWVPAEHWALTREAYFGAMPIPLRWLVPPIARRGMKRSLDGQGFGRMTDALILERADRDLEALSRLLGDEEHLLGRPSSLDATVFAFVTAASDPPFDGPLQRLVARRDNLVAFCDRVRARR